ncbi:MAG: stage III sporulation protein AE [Clostridia bacterium]|nr:stage III sporulation protein AE [Clostridia bacterium]
MLDYFIKYLRKPTKFTGLLIILVIMQVCWVAGVFAEDLKDEESLQDQLIEQQMNTGDVKKIEQQLNRYADEDFKKILAEFDPQKILRESTTGKFEFSLVGFINKGLMYIFKEIYVNVHILIKLVILIVLCSILKNLQTSFLSESVGELAFYTCYVVIVSILIMGFNTAMNLGRDIIDKMVSFMQATIPVMVTLMITGGNITSAGIFQPILIMIVQVVATILKDVLIPMIFLYTVLTVVDNISDKVQISKLKGMLKQVSTWILGTILTIFIGVVTVQGSLGAVVDGVTSKTAKFAIGAFIPIAGKYLADAADAVVSCTLLIKNAAGVAAMIGIVAICLVPLLKIFAIMALYKLTCVLVEPIAEKRITNCINDISGSLTFIIGIVASVAFMFLISITAIISASNISAMIR